METKQRQRASSIDEYCEQAGCTEKQRNLHRWRWDKKRWHSHPIPSFVAWWEPTHTDSLSGASVGGHPEARRVWARKDPGRWTRRWYGVPTESAWNTAWVLIEFAAWQEAGSPEPNKPFISIAATLQQQGEFWRGLHPMLERIGK